MTKETLKSTPLKGRGDIVVAFIAVAIVIVFLVFFLRQDLVWQSGQQEIMQIW